MRITSYGLFWRASQINWAPGSGTRGEFNLFGKIGERKPKLRVADFRLQQGIYILYDAYGPAYTGLTRASLGLGKRLKDHTNDHLKDRWDRFCWFGFRNIGQTVEKSGIHCLIDANNTVKDDTYATIGDLESLLIRLLGTKLNISKMKFENAEEWKQVPLEDRENILDRIKP